MIKLLLLFPSIQSHTPIFNPLYMDSGGLIMSIGGFFIGLILGYFYAVDKTTSRIRNAFRLISFKDFDRVMETYNKFNEDIKNKKDLGDEYWENKYKELSESIIQNMKNKDSAL